MDQKGQKMPLDWKDKDLMAILDAVGEKLSPEDLVTVASQTTNAFVGMRALDFLKPFLDNFSLEELLKLYMIGVYPLPLRTAFLKRLQLKFNSLTHEELMQMFSEYKDNSDVLMLIIRTGKLALEELITLARYKTKDGSWLWDIIAEQIKAGKFKEKK